MHDNKGRLSDGNWKALDVDEGEYEISTRSKDPPLVLCPLSLMATVSNSFCDKT